jgi:hypothetical protein
MLKSVPVVLLTEHIFPEITFLPPLIFHRCELPQGNAEIAHILLCLVLIRTVPWHFSTKVPAFQLPYIFA